MIVVTVAAAIAAVSAVVCTPALSFDSIALLAPSLHLFHFHLSLQFYFPPHIVLHLLQSLLPCGLTSV